MCDVMPTIAEDGSSSQGDRDSNSGGEGANVEDMLLNMLDERDRLMDALNEAQEQMKILQMRLEECERERATLQEQLKDTLPQDVVQLTKELHQTRERLNEREEEVADLKAERNNTRLLLEHLECLVSRHERSLRMTVVKRQTTNPAGVSSEVEVLKALKSLFEHHKALDEKVRERLRLALEKNSQLEAELAHLQQQRNGPEGAATSDTLKLVNGAAASPDLKSPRSSNPPNQFRLSNGGMGVPDSQLEEQRQKEHDELLESRRRLGEITTQVKELEDELKNAQRETVRGQEQLERVQRELRESEAQREDQESRIVTLEKRYLSAQRECTTAHDLSDKLAADLAEKETRLKQLEDKLRALQERPDQHRLSLIVPPSHASTITEASSVSKTIDSGAAASSLSTELLSQAGAVSHESVAVLLEETLRECQNELEEARAELTRARQREKLSEQHNSRLTATVDKLLQESNERLQAHLTEKMQTLEEKSHLQVELDRCRRQLEDASGHRDHLMTEVERLRRELSEARVATLASSTAAQTAALSGDLGGEFVLNESGTAVFRRMQPGRYNIDLGQVNTLGEGDWDKLQQEQLLANVHQAFDPNPVLEFPGMGAVESSGAAPGGGGEAQAIARMLQEQLNAINMEISLIQREKEAADEQLAEGLLLHQEGLPIYPSDGPQPRYLDPTAGSPRCWSPPPPNATALMLATAGASGRSTPVLQPHMGMEMAPWAEYPSGTPPVSSTSMRPTLPAHMMNQQHVGIPPNSAAHLSHYSLSTPQLSSTGRYPSLPPSGRSGDVFAVATQPQSAGYYPTPYVTAAVSSSTATAPTAGAPRYAMGAGYPPSARSQMNDPNQLEAASSGESLTRLNQTTVYNAPDPNATTGTKDMRHIRCETSPTPLGATGMSSTGTYVPHHLRHMQTNNNTNNMMRDSPPQSSPSSGSQDSLNRAALAAGHPGATPFLNPSVAAVQPKKKSRLGSLGRIFRSSSSHKEQQSSAASSSSSSSKSPVPPHATAAPNPNVAAPQLRNDADNETMDNFTNSQSAPYPQHSEERRRKKKEELLDEVMRSGTPFALWNGPTIVAWLELWVCMPAWYVAACRANVKSGAIMGALSDQEIQREIGISNPLHRMKLRLAIQEMIQLTAPRGPTSATSLPLTSLPAWQLSSVRGEMGHNWVGCYWLPSLGLGQYKAAFMECLVDVRMLQHLTKKELRLALKMSDTFHRTSLQWGNQCLRMLSFDLHALLIRREDAAQDPNNRDLVVWTNERVIAWVESLGTGLRELAANLRNSGVHGAVFLLDAEFDASHLAQYLQVGQPRLRERLTQEYDKLLREARQCASATSLASEVSKEVGEGSTGSTSSSGSGLLARIPSWRQKARTPTTVSPQPSGRSTPTADPSGTHVTPRATGHPH